MKLFVKCLTLIAVLIQLGSGVLAQKECREIEEQMYLKSAVQFENDDENQLEELLNCGNESPESMLSAARYLYNQGKYDDALKAFQRVISDDVSTQIQRAQAHYYLGEILYAQGLQNTSIEHLNKALESAYMPHWCHNTIGNDYLDLNENELARQQFEMSLKYKPNYAVAINNLGVALERLGNAELAQTLYSKADSLTHGASALYFSNYTRLLIKQNKEDEAFERSKIGVVKFPHDQRVVYDHARLLCLQGQYKESLKYARVLQELGPQSTEDYHNIGYIYDESGRLDSAYLFYSAALAIDPMYKASNHNKSIILKLWGKFDESHKHLDLVLAVDSTYELAINSKIQTYIWQYDFESALKWCETYNRHYYGRKHSFLNSGYVLMQMKRYEDAIPWFEKKLADVPNDDRAINNMGRCYGKLGQPDRAFKLFDAALKINPNNSYVYHNRASLQADLGNFDAACKDLDIAMSLQYNWLIDSNLIEMQKTHCPEVNIKKTLVLHGYKGNNPELEHLDFIRLEEAAELIKTEIDTSAFYNEINANKSTSGNQQNLFQVYPNPNIGYFTVQNLGYTSEELSVSIYTIDGQIIYSQELNPTGTTRINVQQLDNGTYYMLIMNPSTVITTKKVIVAK